MLHTKPVITPLNSLLYNSSPQNLASHGLHPYYQHFLANLPQLLGPAFAFLFYKPRINLPLISAVGGTFFLSLLPHQESRFLIPCVPLLLTSIRLPINKSWMRVWVVSWILFNSLFGLLMGVYHQGGVVSTQLWIGKNADTRFVSPSQNLPSTSPISTTSSTTVFWWKTYSPPIWLLDGQGHSITTHDMMGIPGPHLIDSLLNATASQCTTLTSMDPPQTILVAPRSAIFLDDYLPQQASKGGKENELSTTVSSGSLRLNEIHVSKNHLNLDDLDFSEDGVWNTLKRVIGRRGLVTWVVERRC